MSAATAVSPITYPHLRETSQLTLASLARKHDKAIEALSIDSGEQITVAPGLDTVMVKNREIELNDASVAALATYVDFPKGFFDRLDPDLKASWMNELLHRKRGLGVVRVGKRSGLISVLSPNQVPIEAHHIITVASKILGPDATVIELENTPTSFGLDVVTSNPRQNLGDKKIGDITKAGVRFGLNQRQNLAPTVNPYYFRLWCTNGASSINEGTKIDARGATVEEVIGELEIKARLAFAAVETEVAAMYELRNDKVASPERTLSRMAREHGLSDRLRLRAIDALPSMVEDMSNVSMFEIINAVTHLANDASVRTRGARLDLETFGASVIAHHIERCTACAARLN